jgi:hypothetical protein
MSIHPSTTNNDFHANNHTGAGAEEVVGVIELPVLGADAGDGDAASARPAVPADGPENRPSAVAHARGEFVWDEDAPPAENYGRLGRRLSAAADLYRREGHEGGLLLAPASSGAAPLAIDTARRLAALLVDRLCVKVRRKGNSKSSHLPASDLNTMLCSDTFLGEFRPVDDVLAAPAYMANLEWPRPGYNDGGPGQRFLYTGPEVGVAHSLDALSRFLDVMAFAGEADRTNAVAAALTVMLRHLWPGAKPLVLATSSKSHGGKDTVIQFACGCARWVSISYQATDWALERCFVGAVKQSPDAGVVVVDNARPGKGARHIASAFLERLLTDVSPLLFSTGTGAPVRRRNNLVVALSTNDPSVSEDLMNRALPIRLEPVGDVAGRESPIGNPKLEYLPANRALIQAELRGMVERWKAAGRPEDLEARHPFTEWARWAESSRSLVTGSFW